MTNTPIPLADAVDPIPATFFPWLPEFVARRLPERVNRDEVRTPMQWDSTANAGFCPPEAHPWLPLHPRARERNVASQKGQPGSLLELYRDLIALRRSTPGLRNGTLALLDGMPSGVVAYTRGAQNEGSVTVVLNFGSDATVVDVSGHRVLVLATDERCVASTERLHLVGHSGAVVASRASTDG